MNGNFRISLYSLRQNSIYKSLSKTNQIAIILDGNCEYVGEFLEKVSRYLLNFFCNTSLLLILSVEVQTYFMIPITG